MASRRRRKKPHRSGNSKSAGSNAPGAVPVAVPSNAGKRPDPFIFDEPYVASWQRAFLDALMFSKPSQSSAFISPQDLHKIKRVKDTSDPRKPMPPNTTGKIKKAHIIVRDDEIRFISPWNESAVNAIKAEIPYDHRMWNASLKYWRVTPTLEFLKTLLQLTRTHYGYEPEIMTDQGIPSWMKTGQASGLDKSTFYTTLNIPTTSTPEEIKKAYRTRAIEFHPDKNQDNPRAADHFIAVKEAYEKLSNVRLRKRYDAGLRLAGTHAPAPAPPIVVKPVVQPSPPLRQTPSPPLPIIHKSPSGTVAPTKAFSPTNVNVTIKLKSGFVRTMTMITGATRLNIEIAVRALGYDLTELVESIDQDGNVRMWNNIPLPKKQAYTSAAQQGTYTPGQAMPPGAVPIDLSMPAMPPPLPSYTDMTAFNVRFKNGSIELIAMPKTSFKIIPFTPVLAAAAILKYGKQAHKAVDQNGNYYNL